MKFSFFSKKGAANTIYQLGTTAAPAIVTTAVLTYLLINQIESLPDLNNSSPHTPLLDVCEYRDKDEQYLKQYEDNFFRSFNF